MAVTVAVEAVPEPATRVEPFMRVPGGPPLTLHCACALTLVSCPPENVAVAKSGAEPPAARLAGPVTASRVSVAPATTGNGNCPEDTPPGLMTSTLQPAAVLVKLGFKVMD